MLAYLKYEDEETEDNDFNPSINKKLKF